MVGTGSPTLARSRGACTVAATLLALLLVLLAAAPSAHAISRDAAAKKALAALGTESNDDPVIVFGLRGALRPRTVISQAAPSGGAVASRGRGAFGRARTKRIKRAGVVINRADVIMRVGAEPAFFFFEDRGPHQAFEHPGRVALVGARTGKVRMSDTTRWVPLVNGRQPAFFRNAANYEAKRYRVLSRPWTTPDANRARKRQAPDGSPRQILADALAAEKSCALRISDTLGDFFDFGRVDKTRARLGHWFEGLERLNAGFVSRRYTTKEGQTPIQAAQALIDEAGCRDLFFYVAGAAPRVGEEGIVIGMRSRPGGLIEWHVLTAAELEALVQANPAVTFKFFFDVPYSRVNDDLIDEPNTVVLLSSGGPGEASFTFLPEVLGPNGIQGNPANPDQLLEFTNAIITGFHAFVNNPAELAHGMATAPANGISMMSWMLARAMALSPAWIFSAPLDLIKLPEVSGPGGPPAPPAPPPPPPVVEAAPNRAPRGTTPAQPTDEDTPRAITLTATDADGDPLTFTITDQPDHGDLTGTPPNLTYTPDQDFDGDDAFTYQVSDGRGGTDTQTVQIPITPDNDAAAVTTTSGGSAAFTEDGSPVVIDGGLTIADPDSTQLEGATVSITNGFQAGDELVFVDQSGITGTYNTGTGVLTLTGTASESDYQAALRSVQFDSTQQNPTTSRTIEFRAEDGDEAGAPASRGVTITPVNDAPTVDPTDAALAYTENSGAVALDDGLELDDVDSATLAGATVQITGAFNSANDELAFVNTAGISGSYNDSTGTLTLSGTDTLANYQTALRSVTYENVAENPSGSKTVSFQLDDGAGANNLSAVEHRGIDLTAANDAPVVNTSAGDTSYTEGNAGTVIDGALTVSDVDDTNIESAQVRVSSGFESGDDLTFVNTANITGTYNTGTGVLTLSGTDTVANYQAALRSITFDNTVDDSLQAKTIEFKVNDGDADSAVATKNIAITGANDASTVSTTGSTLSYTEGSAPVAVDDGLTVSDPDSASLAGATVQITSNFVSAADELTFVNTASITGAYNDTTGTLTLSGTDTVANYQAALRSVTYESTDDNPSGTKTVSFQVDDGAAANNLSNVATRDIGFVATNDAPVVTTSAGSTSYSEGDAGTIVDNALTLSDADDTNLEGGTVSISSNFQSGDDLVFVDQSGISGVYNAGSGLLTLSGTASVSDYQTALRSIEYQHTGDNPSAGKQVSFTVTDGDTNSNTAVKGINLTGANDAPVLNTSAGDTSYTEGSAAATVDGSATISDPDDTNLDSGQVRISSGFQTGDTLTFVDQNGISGSYNSGTGVLTLSTPSGEASVADWQTALRSITFGTTHDSPTASRTIEFKVNDGSADSNTPTKGVAITPTNDAPTVVTSGGSTSYTEGDPATTVDGSLVVGDADDVNLEGGQVRISTNFESGDDLVFVDQNGISGTYNSGSGVLTLTGTSSVANYQTALRSIQFQHTGDNPAASKTVEFKVNDGDTDSNLATKDIAITRVNDAPTVNTSGSPLLYAEGDGPEAVDSTLTTSDPDSTQYQGATVAITSNFVSADDELAFADTPNITGSYNDSTGTLTLSGVDTVANYQTALRAVTYENSSDNPSGSKTVSFQATDAQGAASTVATRDINLSGVNDAPTVTTSAGNTAYTEGGSAATVDSNLTVADPDDTNLESAQVRISNNFQSGDDLVFVDQNGISGNYNSGTGVLTLSGTASTSDYQTALRSIQFQTTNDNPTASKTVEFKVNDGDVGSNAATKGLAITGVNDAPTLNTTGADRVYTEGDGAVVIDNGLTLTDPDSTQIQGATVSITSGFVASEDTLASAGGPDINATYNPSTGVMTLTGTDTVANYQAVLRAVTYSNSSDNPSGSKTVSFQATDAEGAASNVATRDIDLIGANDAPTVTTSAGSTAYTEGDVATPVDPALTLSDPDDTNLESGEVRIASNFEVGDVLTFVTQNGITGIYNPATGELTLTGSASEADWQTALRSITYSHVGDDPAASKTVEFKVNDGSSDSNTPLKGLNITGVNDAPTVNTSAGTTAFIEDSSGPVAVDPNLTVSDPDSNNLSGATVSITTNFNSSEDELEFTNQNGITGNYNSGTGVLTLSGSAAVADYQTALRSVAYDNTDTVAPSTATRTVSFQVTDSSAAASNAATKDVSVQSVNDAPVINTSAGSTPYTEDDPATTIDGSLTVSDQDDTNLEGGQVRISSGFQSGDDLVFVNQNGISGTYNTGTGVLALSGTATVADYQTALRSIQFQSTNQQPVTSKTIEFKVNDGDVDSNAATKEMAVTPTNDGPIVTAGGTLAYTENDPATAVHSAMTIDDLENDFLSGGSASITANYAAGQDFLNWVDNNPGDNITLDNINTDQQTIVLTGLDTEANYQAALRAVTYQNGSDNPTTSNRTVTFSATDQPGLTGSDTRTISVTAVDDPPTAVNDSATVLEDAAATSVNVLPNDTDPDGGPKTISSASDPANGAVVLTGGSPGAHTGLTYQPDPNYCNDPPGTTPDTFQYTLNGGSNATVSMTVTCVNDAPVADDELFDGNSSAHGNTTMQVDDPDDNKSAPTNPHTEISGDILAGDTDIDGPGPMTVTPGTFATNDGGSVTLESDGDFVFQPAATTSCTDTSDFFDYTVEDSGSPEQTDTGRVTIAIAGCVWYVKNNAPTGPGNNDGSSDTPFVTLSQAETASGTNHTVFVYDGDNTPTGYDAGGYAMNSGERLIGEHEGLTVDPDQGGSLTADTLHPANPGAHPTLTSTGAGLDVIDLDDGNEIRGFNIDPQTGHGGIQGSTGDTGGGTIDDVNIVDSFGSNGTQAGLELNGTTGTFNISNFVVNNSATGVLLNNAGTAVFSPSGQISITTVGAKGLDVTGTNMGTSTFDDITVTGSNAGGVNLLNATGTTTFGDGTGTDLDLTTTSGSTGAFVVSNSGTVSVATAGSDDVHATGGPAIDVTGTSGPTLQFDDVDSTNSANDGINLDGLGGGTFSASLGDISGAAGISFDLNGGSGAITYPGNLNNGGGTTAIEITGRSGGVVSLTGPISDTNDAGGGINLASNTGGSTSFTNGTKQLNTGAGDALLFNSSDGHSLALSGGGLDIDTTSGKGLEASTSGSIEVSGSGNTIDTTTGRALNVSDTDIANNDLTFQRISSNGASNGIRLNTTANAAGALNVLGTGGTCSSAGTCTGGAIQGSSGAGIELTSVPGGVNLTRMAVTNGGDDGIRATTVGTGVSLVSSFLSGNGNAVTENGLHYVNVTGTSTISATTVTGSGEHNAQIDSGTGTHNIDVIGSTFSLNNSSTGGDGLQITGANAGTTVNADVTTSVITQSRDAGFRFQNSTGDPTMNVNFINNDVTGGHPTVVPGAPGIVIASGQGTDVKARVENNDVLNSNGSGIIVNPIPNSTDASSHETIVNNNRIGNGSPDSGSASGIGLWVQANGSGDSRIAITNNTIRNWQQNAMRIQSGERILGGDPSTNQPGTAHVTVTGNTASTPDPSAVDTISLIAGVQSGAAAQDVCFDLGGAGGLSNAIGGQVGTGGGFDLKISERFAANLWFPGFAGDGTDQNVIQTFVRSRNTGNPTVALIDNGISGGAACTQPTSPPAVTP